MDYAIGDIHGCLDKVLRLLEVYAMILRQIA